VSEDVASWVHVLTARGREQGDNDDERELSCTFVLVFSLATSLRPTYPDVDEHEPLSKESEFFGL
jgi:hypothetical protein